MISSYHGKQFNLEELRIKCYTNKNGTLLKNLLDTLKEIGFETLPVQISFDKLLEGVLLPAILLWKEQHYVVIYKISEKFIYIADPAFGLLKYKYEEFRLFWENKKKGIVILIKEKEGYKTKVTRSRKKKLFRHIYTQFYKFKKIFVWIILFIVLSTIFLFITPYFTKLIIDQGIFKKNIGFIRIIIFGQLFIYLGYTIASFMEKYLLLRIASLFNIKLTNEFFIKLLGLPLTFFNSKSIGNILQRLGDYDRIANFAINTAITLIISIVYFIVCSIILMSYNSKIFFIFMVFTIIYYIVVLFLQKSKKVLEYKSFSLLTENNNKFIEFLQGIQDIKLFNYGQIIRENWLSIYNNIHSTKIKTHKITLYQQNIGKLILNIRNLIITYVLALYVINSQISFGEMISIQFIIGLLNLPLEQISDTFKNSQDAIISLDRHNEIMDIKDDTNLKHKYSEIHNDYNSDLIVRNLSFGYSGKNSPIILNNLSFRIPNNGVTAIVGASGSGKSTLIKLLLGFYSPLNGTIHLGDIDLQKLSSEKWLSISSAVLQDSYIFSDTIKKNITLENRLINEKKLTYAINIANIYNEIYRLPQGIETKIGNNGLNLSQGQKQRILIARAVYKAPQYLFMDEATNSLDAENERIIVQNLNKFFKTKTVVLVAHRLSTIKYANQIIVLKNGRISEIGNHFSLIEKKGTYFQLIKSQAKL